MPHCSHPSALHRLLLVLGVLLSAGCGDTTCPPGHLVDCDGLCVPPGRLGDGTCDLDLPDLSCEAFRYDLGDCPRPGEPPADTDPALPADTDPALPADTDPLPDTATP